MFSPIVHSNRRSKTHYSDIQLSQVFQSGTNFDYVIHTASPYSFKIDDPVKDFLDPAIKGTTGILKSIKAHGPSVKRVVITSSSAAIINPLKHEKVYDERKWAPFTWNDATEKPQFGYPASKVSYHLPLFWHNQSGIPPSQKLTTTTHRN